MNAPFRLSRPAVRPHKPRPFAFHVSALSDPMREALRDLLKGPAKLFVSEQVWRGDERGRIDIHWRTARSLDAKALVNRSPVLHLTELGRLFAEQVRG